ncbi:hypothetical protein AK812_SmicGene35179 [Symbiodinium microadriaticum]|uniref:Uncharacterized protein n=1 Tax=Symbiodinium microadriaticum TaxID=2951 RepID=A0A1Q9CM29_SYMMI|nr:hypothetical protein AK812_SmicGene35179 [Symbiodinium microadriaticum]
MQVNMGVKQASSAQCSKKGGYAIIVIIIISNNNISNNNISAIIVITISSNAGATSSSGGLFSEGLFKAGFHPDAISVAQRTLLALARLLTKEEAWHPFLLSSATSQSLNRSSGGGLFSGISGSGTSLFQAEGCQEFGFPAVVLLSLSELCSFLQLKQLRIKEGFGELGDVQWIGADPELRRMAASLFGIGASTGASAVEGFQSADAFTGAKEGYAFKSGDAGLGYYPDAPPKPADKKEKVYAKHNPDKAGASCSCRIDGLLAGKYKGKELEMYQKVCQKYGVTPEKCPHAAAGGLAAVAAAEVLRLGHGFRAVEFPRLSHCPRVNDPKVQQQRQHWQRKQRRVGGFLHRLNIRTVQQHQWQRKQRRVDGCQHRYNIRTVQ